jgi:hypothetical protein
MIKRTCPAPIKNYHCRYLNPRETVYAVVNPSFNFNRSYLELQNLSLFSTDFRNMHTKESNPVLIGVYDSDIHKRLLHAKTVPP